MSTGEMSEESVRAVRVQAVFHVSDDRQAQIVAAKMVDRAHEIANTPECECDVDVSIERAPPGTAANALEPGEAPTRRLPTKI